MKRIIAIENLLLLFPVATFVFGLFYLLSGNAEYEGMLDSHVVPYFIGEIVSGTLMWIALIGSAYFIHYFLRAIHAGNRAVCFSHVLLTIGIPLYLFVSPTEFPYPVPDGWYNAVEPPFFRYQKGLNYWLACVYWLVQLAFVLYGLVVIRKWRKEHALSVAKRFPAIEHLLLLFPVSTLAFSLYRLFSGAIARYRDVEQSWVIPGVISDTASATLEWIVLILPGYLMHYLLRYTAGANRAVRFLHVLFTIGILGYLAFFGTSRLYSDVPEWQQIEDPPYVRGWTDLEYWLTVLFWLVQGTFVVYGLIIIHKWKRNVS
jgi:hypothetical protein